MVPATRRQSLTNSGPFGRATVGYLISMTDASNHDGRHVLPAAAGYGPLAEEPSAADGLQQVDPRAPVENRQRQDMPPAGVNRSVAPGGRGVTDAELPLDLPADERGPGERWAITDPEAQREPGDDPDGVAAPLSRNHRRRS